jgi:hypothetical protein
VQITEPEPSDKCSAAALPRQKLLNLKPLVRHPCLGSKGASHVPTRGCPFACDASSNVSIRDYVAANAAAVENWF